MGPTVARLRAIYKTVCRVEGRAAGWRTVAAAPIMPPMASGELDLGGGRRERILVVNCGSSSLKYAFFDTGDGSRTARGHVERIGAEGTRHVWRGPDGPVETELAGAGYAEALAAMASALVARAGGVLESADEISLVVHRIVHGGAEFTEATAVDESVIRRIDALGRMAPLHNPAGVAGMREMQRLFPAAPHVAVFDTSFHHTMPEHAAVYGLPYEYAADKGVRRYGFHGPSHSYVALRAAEFLGRDLGQLRLVTCHLGNGCSLCAVERGRSVDTTMGFTPAEGLVMGTRCGDLDTGVLAFLERTEGLTADQAEDLLNRRSGLFGLSGISGDMREVEAAADAGHERARLALDVFCYRVRKGIGAFAAAMGGVDAIVFTGGIGQGSAEVRRRSLDGLAWMGARLDVERNRHAKGFEEISRVSTDASTVSVLVVPTDEERMMAREALRALAR
jgi:acetate kinase